VPRRAAQLHLQHPSARAAARPRGRKARLADPRGLAAGADRGGAQRRERPVTLACARRSSRLT